MHYFAGKAYDDKGEYLLALQMYTKAIQLNPNDYESHLKLAIIYDDYLNKNKKAIKHYQIYLKANPNNSKSKLVKEWMDLILNKDSDSMSANLESENRESSNQIKEIENQIHELKIENLHLKKSINQSLKREQILEAQARELRKQVFDLPSIKAQLKKANQELIQSKLYNSREVRRPTASDNSDIDTIKASLEDYKREYENYQQKESQWNLELEEMNRLIDQYKVSLQKLHDENLLIRQNMQNQILEKEDYLEQIEKLTLQVNKDKMNKNAMGSQLEKKNSVLEKEISILRAESEELLQKMNNLNQIATLQKQELDLAKENNLSIQREYNKLLMASKNLKQSLPLNTKRNVLYYRVKKGENLRSIAEKYLGDKNRWNELYKINQSSINNPNILSPGQLLIIYMD